MRSRPTSTPANSAFPQVYPEQANGREKALRSKFYGFPTGRDTPSTYLMKTPLAAIPSIGTSTSRNSISKQELLGVVEISLESSPTEKSVQAHSHLWRQPTGSSIRPLHNISTKFNHMSTAACSIVYLCSTSTQTSRRLQAMKLMRRRITKRHEYGTPMELRSD